MFVDSGRRKDMAVLVEAISVVVRATAIEKLFPGGWEAFESNPPNGRSVQTEN